MKLFVQSGRSGIVYEFEFYQGKNIGISAKYKEIELGGSVAIRFVENLPQNENFNVYFYNFFTGIQLLAELKNKGAFGLKF